MKQSNNSKRVARTARAMDKKTGQVSLDVGVTAEEAEEALGQARNRHERRALNKARSSAKRGG